VPQRDRQLPAEEQPCAMQTGFDGEDGQPENFANVPVWQIFEIAVSFQ
jgi:hypothetical protein